jgi:hypothetical protein
VQEKEKETLPAASELEQGRRQSILDSFSYHQPSAHQVLRITNIREAHKALVRVIFDNTQPSADQTAALRKLHECMMTCNKAIVCEVAK